MQYALGSCKQKTSLTSCLLLFCSGIVLQVLFHPKQLTLVTSGDDADVRVWDLVSKSCIAVLKVDPQIYCLPLPPPPLPPGTPPQFQKGLC